MSNEPGFRNEILRRHAWAVPELGSRRLMPGYGARVMCARRRDLELTGWQVEGVLGGADR